jgi:hypothetical protein
MIISETTSDNSVSFFKMPIDLLFKNGTQQQIVTVDLNRNNQRFTLPIAFVPDTVLIDPAQYFITYNNTSSKVTSLPAEAPLTLLLYPNPVGNNMLRVRTNSSEQKKMQMSIFNAVGGRVMQRSVMLNENASFTLPVAHLSAGMYFLSVDSGNGKIVTEKFIKY